MDIVRQVTTAGIAIGPGGGYYYSYFLRYFEMFFFLKMFNFHPNGSKKLLYHILEQIVLSLTQ